MPLTPQNLKKTLTQLCPSDHYAVAVSGGSDSLALTALIAGIKDCQFSVLTVDHQMRPEAKTEAKMVAEICAQLNLPHTILTAPTPPKSQAEARKTRYDLMQKFCAQNNIHALILAHHLDDQAETYMMRLAKGSGIDGLAAMQPLSHYQNLTLIRPLLQYAKQDLQKICAKHKLKPIEDPSNQNLKYERIRWRKALPMLEQLGLTKAKIARATQQMQRQKIRATKTTTQFIKTHCTKSNNQWRITRTPFQNLPDDIAHRTIDQLCRDINPKPYPLRRRALKQALLKIKTQTTHTIGNCIIKTHKNTITIKNEQK